MTQSGTDQAPEPNHNLAAKMKKTDAYQSESKPEISSNVRLEVISSWN